MIIMADKIIDDVIIKKAINDFCENSKGIVVQVGKIGGILEIKELINEFDVKALDDFYLEENKIYPEYGWYRKFEKKRF